MSYVVVDANGYVGELASNLGLEELARFSEIYPNVPALQAMIQEGFTDVPEQVLAELIAAEARAGQALTDDLRQTIRGLIDALKKADEVAIITQ